MHAPWLVPLALALAGTTTEAQESRPPAQRGTEQAAPAQEIEPGLGEAIGRGLAWLAKAQQPDGSWAHPRSEIAATSLAALAFLSAGSTPRAGPHAESLRVAIRWLEQRRLPSGLIADPQSGYGGYEHALATCALVRAYAVSKAPWLRDSAQQAVDTLAASRNPDRGWGFVRGGSHTTVVSRVVAALVAARAAGLRVDPKDLEAARGWSDRVSDQAAGSCWPCPEGPGPLPGWFPATSPLATTAAGLAALMDLGVEGADATAAGKLAASLIASPPVWQDGANDFDAWCLAAEALLRVRGFASTWGQHLTVALLPHQRRQGAEAGSWDADCRSIATALAIRALAVPAAADVVRGGVGRGSPAPARYASRAEGRKHLARSSRSRIAQAIEGGLEWLARHQDEDGRWDCDAFMKHDPAGDACDGRGNATNDIGATGLALLAFLADGSTLRSGRYQDNLKRGIVWLKDQQGESGLIGTEAGRAFMYNHAIATQAVVEAYGLSQYRTMRHMAQRAVDFIVKARNPYKVWRYYPHDGDNDTSVTGWMVAALVSAASFDLTIDRDALRYAQAWLEEVTNPATGQAGYTKRGEGSSREVSTVQKFPSASTEALTAVGLLCRIFIKQTELGQDSKIDKQEPVWVMAADTMLKKPPRWEDGSIDLYYWYFGSHAMYQMGGRHWKEWRGHLEVALLDVQRTTGSAQGSWDPAGAWGHEGGRVYATALAVLSLQTHYRYASLIR